MLDAQNHSVTIFDLDENSFRWLPAEFKGKAIIADGIDDDGLIRANIDDADVFVATTQGDNRNILAAQKAKFQFNVPKVVCRLYDPIRKELYRDLGIETISPTTVTAELLQDAIER